MIAENLSDLFKSGAGGCTQSTSPFNDTPSRSETSPPIPLPDSPAKLYFFLREEPPFSLHSSTNAGLSPLLLVYEN